MLRQHVEIDTVRRFRILHSREVGVFVVSGQCVTLKPPPNSECASAIFRETCDSATSPSELHQCPIVSSN